MSYVITWAGCEQRPRPFLSGHHMAALNPVLFAALDDVPYYNSTGTYFGQAMTGVTVASVKTHWEAQLANMLLDSGWQAMLAKRTEGMLMLYTPGDHGWGGDNWDHTITAANATGSGIGAVTQADVDYHWWQGNQHMLDQAWFDNVMNTDPLAVPEKPSNADAATPASNYPVRYFKLGFDVDGVRNDAAPHCEVFMLDDVSYKDPMTATAGPTKTMLGANQKAWFKAKLLASTAVFKVIFCAKKSLPSKTSAGTLWDNLDGFLNYIDERNELLSFIASNGITGVVWLSGDSHIPTVESLRVSDGDAYDHLNVCAAPCGNDIKSDFSMVAINSQTRLKMAKQAFGSIVIEPTRMKLHLHDAATGQAVWAGEILAGSNALSYVSAKFC